MYKIINKIVDVLIVGSGVSGLYSSLNLRDDLEILLATKSDLQKTNTSLAQGGISTARDENDIELFIEDTLKAGKYKNNVDAVKILAKESESKIIDLINLGVDFDIDNNNLKYTKEGAHSTNRIVHIKDKTGKGVEDTLIKRVKEKENIHIYEYTYLVDIIKDKNKCLGAVLIKDNIQFNIYAKKVILATGGIGGVFKNTTNQKILNGDSIAIALKHNIKLKNLDYIQIHPTAFFEDEKDERRLLISEAVRGEGAKLIDINGERFIDELLPRDIVSKAIFNQMKKTNSSYVSLDLTFMDKEYVIKRFPYIYSECLKRGVDITKDYIKVSPAQHYFMGGIDVSLDSKTSLENLYAVGETSCTGVHGANRLASNSLLEGLVFSKRASDSINNTIDDINITIKIVDKLKENINDIRKNNKKIVIEAIKENCEGFDDELFDYR